MSSIRALVSSWVSLLGVKHTPLPLLEFPEKNTLAGLPTELLWLITDFLSWNDRICLSLCNRQLFTTYHHRNGPPSKSEKLSFLICLERDTPAFFACHVCHILHKYHPSKNYGRTFFDYDSDHVLPCAFKWDRRHNGSLIMDPENDILSSSPYRICFFHLQLAMKRFLYGPQFGISTKSLSYTCVQVRIGEPLERPILSSTDAQIGGSPPGLILRTQRIIYVPANRRYLLYANKNIYRRSRKFYSIDSPICGHVSGGKVADLSNNIVRAHRDGKKAPFFISSCAWCHTDFRIEVCSHKSDLALVTTKWSDLGAGPTPDSPKWALHSNKAKRIFFEDSIRKPRNYRKSARALFQTTSSLSMTALRSRNFSYLENQRYKKIMHERFAGSWEL